MIIKYSILVYLILIIPTIGFAEKPVDVNGWNGAKWGMSIEELQKVFNGRIQKIENPSHGGRFYPLCEYQITGYKIFSLSDETVTVQFCINDSKIFGKISITCDEETRGFPQKILDGLWRNYSKPDRVVVEIPDLNFTTTYWYFPTTTIKYSVVGDSCFVDYEDKVYQDSL